MIHRRLAWVEQHGNVAVGVISTYNSTVYSASGANLRILRAFGLQMSWRLSLMLCLFCFDLLCFVFRLYDFVEAAALRSIVLRYAGAPIATRVPLFSLLFIWRCRFFRVFFVPFPLSLCMERTSYVLSFRMVFLPCDRGLDF